MRKRVAIALVVLATTSAFGEGFGPRFRDGYEKLRSGDPEAALASFQNLLTETPDSELVQYSIAAAEYALGVKEFDAGDIEAANESLQRARGKFDELRTASTPFVREQSGFGAANALAQVGKHLDEQQAYKERRDALQAAVQAYDAFLEVYPDHEDARTNLNHTSYLLKKLLQNPPPDQQSEDDEGEGENQDQSQQGQQGQQPEQSEPQDDQPQEPEDSQSEDTSDTPQDQASDSEKTQDENIEAILQSLEDKNQQEQKNLRRAKEPPRVRDGKWW
jgi:hypothetical protein